MEFERTYLLSGQVALDQPIDGYRVAIDAVLAAAAVPAKPGDLLLDAGAGSGAIALCLAARISGLQILAVEREQDHAELAQRNINLNDKGHEVELAHASIFNLPAELRRDFDHVVTNPPYHQFGRHRLPKNSSKAVAGHEEQSLQSWLAACLKRLRTGGWLTLIHKADTLAQILDGLSPYCGDVSVIPIWPREDARSAKRVVVRARKASRGPLRLARGLILHGLGNSYTAEARAILRDGQALCDEV